LVFTSRDLRDAGVMSRDPSHRRGHL